MDPATISTPKIQQNTIQVGNITKHDDALMQAR
jgi:hypothetical protein